jgi:hypothetical protein
MLPRLTIRPASLFFSKGRHSRVKATTENKLMLKMLCNSSSVYSVARRPMSPSAGPIPALLTRISSLPILPRQRDRELGDSETGSMGSRIAAMLCGR